MKQDGVSKYFCDHCGKHISNDDLYGPLVVVVGAPRFTHASAQGDFCSTECLSKWAAGDSISKALS